MIPKENLTYYSSLKIDKQERLFEDIYTDIQRYKGLLNVLIEYDIPFAETEGKIFNNHLKSFRHFYGDDEPEEVEETTNPKEVDSLQIDSIN